MKIFNKFGISQSFTKIWLLAILMLSACAPLEVGTSPKELPTYSQNQEFMYGIFRLKIENAYWSGKSLDVEISMTNTDKKPGDMKGLWLTLKNEQDIEYAGSLSYIASIGGNPNMPVTRRIVFEVPKDSYYLVVSRVGGGMGGSRGVDIFRWKLSPEERK